MFVFSFFSKFLNIHFVYFADIDLRSFCCLATDYCCLHYCECWCHYIVKCILTVTFIQAARATVLRYRSRVPVMAGHHCVVALGKLLTPVCLCHQAL